jgi:hypothetical protein
MIANGRAVELKEEIEGFVIRLLDEKGNLLAVGDIDSERRVIKPRIVLMREV